MALLYANLKGEFEPTWHWTIDALRVDTGDEDDESDAWMAGLHDGSQYVGLKDNGRAARAVRLISIEL